MRIQKCILSTVLLLLLSFGSVGYCSETYQITAEQLTTLQNNLTVLEQNNEQLRSLLSQSNGNLTIASEQSDNLRSQLETLSQQLETSRTQVETLKQQLITLKDTTAQAQVSLTTAQNELAKANESLTKYEKEQKEIQSKLRGQKNLWETIAIMSATWAAIK